MLIFRVPLCSWYYLPTCIHTSPNGVSRLCHLPFLTCSQLLKCFPFCFHSSFPSQHIVSSPDVSCSLWAYGSFTCLSVILLVQFSSVAQSCLTLCDPTNRSTPGLPVHHQLLESTQTHVHCVSDAIQPSHPLSSPFPLALNLSQHQGLFKWVNSLHQVAKVLEFQLQHQSLQWTARTDL